MRLFLIWIIGFFFFLFPQCVSAHGTNPGFPVSINGDPVTSYPLEESNVYSEKHVIPNDTASRNFLVGEKVTFVIDPSEAEDPESILVKWDMGDGSRTEGLTVDHVYEKTGSFFVTVESVGTGSEPSVKEIILINVVPGESYKLPKAVITVNGQSGEKDGYNILDFELVHTLEFDASDSVEGGSKIVNYSWEFGDDKSAEGEKVKHRYELPQAFATVLLRVTDENGLINDAIVNVRNSGDNEPNSGLKNIPQLILPVVIVVLIIGGGLVLFGKKKSSPKTK